MQEIQEPIHEKAGNKLKIITPLPDNVQEYSRAEIKEKIQEKKIFQEGIQKDIEYFEKLEQKAIELEIPDGEN